MELTGTLGTLFAFAFIALGAHYFWCLFRMLEEWPEKRSGWWTGSFWFSSSLPPEAARYRKRAWLTLGAIFGLFLLATRFFPMSPSH